MRAKVAELGRILGGTLQGSGEGLVTGAGVDSRKTRPGELFVALRGDFFDGHDFIADAAAAGAPAAVVSAPQDPAPCPQIVVPDTLAALAALGGWARDVCDPIVVGITGSTGKTSTKDLLAAVAASRLKTVASALSYNNEIGVPLTLLAAEPGTQVVICEMGTRGAGQIASLCSYARPQVGVVTNVGVTHYGELGSQEAIAAAKAELVRALPEGGTAVLNADDPLVASMASETEADVLTYGQSGGAWLRADKVRLDPRGRPDFRMVRGDRAMTVEMGLSGIQQVSNALAAAAAGMALGISFEDCCEALEGASASPWRMEVGEAGGVLVVNDAYNASPDSVSAALTTCAAMAAGRRVVAVLGYMAELGEIEEQEHMRVGGMAARLASRLVVAGRRAAPIARGAREEGMQEVVQVEDVLDAPGAIGPLLEGDVVLIKGSRIAGMERLAPLILASLAKGGEAVSS